MWSFTHLDLINDPLPDRVDHHYFIGLLAHHIKGVPILRNGQVVWRDISLIHHFGDEIILLGINVAGPAGAGVVFHRGHVIHMASGPAATKDQNSGDHQHDGSDYYYEFATYHITTSSY